jgi:hypothetical protein
MEATLLLWKWYRGIHLDSSPFFVSQASLFVQWLQTSLVKLRNWRMIVKSVMFKMHTLLACIRLFITLLVSTPAGSACLRPLNDIAHRNVLDESFPSCWLFNDSVSAPGYIAPNGRNADGCELERSGNELICRHLPQVIEVKAKNFSQRVDILAEVWTEYLRNTSLGRCRYVNLLSDSYFSGAAINTC